jgi:hypothetical protein
MNRDVRLSARVTPDLFSAAVERSREEDVTLSRLLESALAEKLGMAPLDTNFRLEVGELRDRVDRLEDFREELKRRAGQEGVTF